jgi:preprotein translocase subunit YajC
MFTFFAYFLTSSYQKRRMKKRRKNINETKKKMERKEI